MKIRNGFVSNSSSSSFIILLDEKNTPCPHCGRQDPNLINMLENDRSDDTKLRAIGKDNVILKLQEEHNDCSWCDYSTILKELEELKEKGNIVYLDLSYHSDLNDLLKSPNVKILVRDDEWIYTKNSKTKN